MADRRRKWDIVLLSLYAAVMLWLLFHREQGEGMLYWEQVSTRLNLVPFVTIRQFWRLLRSERAHLVRLGVVNLAGNVLMFIPLGFLLPGAFPGLKGFWRTLLAAGILICAVEILQMLLLVGFCDVDDLILNLIGSSIGYALRRVAGRKEK